MKILTLETVVFKALENEVEANYVKLDNGKHLVCPKSEASRVEYGGEVVNGEVIGRIGAISKGDKIEIVTDVTLPEDYEDNKYLYENGEFTLNPNYKEKI